MKRRLFNLAAAVSLGMMLAVAALWMRSYWREDLITYADDHSWVAARAMTGTIWLFQGLRHPSDAKWQPGWSWLTYGIINGSSAESLWRIGASRYQTGNDVVRAVFFPCWTAIPLFALLPFYWLLNLRKQWRRARDKCCPTCGYDLRATPDRCPECGTAAGESQRSQRQRAAEGGVAGGDVRAVCSPRMNRRLFNLAAAVSLVIMLAVQSCTTVRTASAPPDLSKLLAVGMTLEEAEAKLRAQPIGGGGNLTRQIQSYTSPLYPSDIITLITENDAHVWRLIDWSIDRDRRRNVGT